MQNKFLLILGILLFSLPLCAKDFFNSTYHLKEGKISLTFLPIYNESSPLMNDTLSTKIFSKNKRIELENISELRRTIDSDSQLVDLLVKISEKEYKDKELKTFPNLNTILSEKELEYIKEKFTGNDIILIPIIFGLKNALGHTVGKSKFRMYDLNTGELILECNKDGNVNVGGESGKGHLTAFMLSKTKDYIESKLLK